MPRKPASENVLCLCRLLNILANISNLFFFFFFFFFAYRQTAWALEEQSDLGPLFCKNDFKNHKQVTKQTAIDVSGSLRIKNSTTIVKR